MAMNATQIVDTILNDAGEFNRFTTGIVRQIVGSADFSEAIVARGTTDAGMVQIANHIAGDAGLSQAIVRAGAGAPVAHVGHAHAVGPNVPCGSIPERGQAYNVRPGFCFPDNDRCNGSILENPDQPKMPIRIRDIFLRDSLFTNFADTSARDLGDMIDPTNAAFQIEPDAGDPNVFNFRNYFFTNSTDQALLRYNANPATNRNLVRLKYDVGFIYARQGGHLDVDIISGGAANPREIAEREVGLKLVPTMSFKKSWTLCPEFFTYRMIPLKAGFMSTYGYKRLLSTQGRTSQLSECTGVKVSDENAVYIYTFVDANGNAVTNNTLINGETRSENNSFAAGDLPYEDGLFKFPKNQNGAQMKVKIAARYPDGILLFHSDDGYFGPVPPFGTIVKVDKLHRGATPRPGYPDQSAHNTIKTALDATIIDITNTNRASYNAKQISFNGANVAINTKQNISDLIIGACGYISMMNAIRILLRDAVGDQTIGGNARSSFRKRRHNNNNKSIKRNKTKSKSKGRGRARAASMLKSAKQRFYRRGGGLGSSEPQPLQCNSPLVSQASPV